MQLQKGIPVEEDFEGREARPFFFLFVLLFFLLFAEIFFAIIISDKKNIQMIKMKITANCKIKEKINNCLIQKQAWSSIEAQMGPPSFEIAFLRHLRINLIKWCIQKRLI